MKASPLCKSRLRSRCLYWPTTKCKQASLMCKPRLRSRCLYWPTTNARKPARCVITMQKTNLHGHFCLCRTPCSLAVCHGNSYNLSILLKVLFASETKQKNQKYKAGLPPRGLQFCIKSPYINSKIFPPERG